MRTVIAPRQKIRSEISDRVISLSKALICAFFEYQNGISEHCSFQIYIFLI